MARLTSTVHCRGQSEADGILHKVIGWYLAHRPPFWFWVIVKGRYGREQPSNRERLSVPIRRLRELERR